MWRKQYDGFWKIGFQDLMIEGDETMQGIPGVSRKTIPSTDEALTHASMQAAQADEETQRELDRKIALLITQKNYERLRAFGFAVVQATGPLGPITSDLRSFES